MGTQTYNQLTFDRNGDILTKFYRIYRDGTENVTRNSTHVMDIADPGKLNPIAVTGELPYQITTFQYKTLHGSILASSAETPITVYVGGIEANNAGYPYAVDITQGIIKFTSVLPSNLTVTIDYWFDGMMAMDWAVPQTGVTYYGPPAIDNSIPNAPTNVTITGDSTLDRVLLAWNPGVLNGEYYYYAVDACDDAGNYSNLSTVGTIFLFAGYAARAYAVERSYDQSQWSVIAMTNETTFSDYGVVLTAPNPVTNLGEGMVLNHNQSNATVELTWATPMVDPEGQSGYYQIRTISASNYWSSPSAIVGPVYLGSAIQQILIRKKQDTGDGSIPSYNGSDAITVCSLSPTITTYTDIAGDNTTWIYAIYRVNKVGNYSIATTISIPVGDATPPIAATGLQAIETSYIY